MTDTLSASEFTTISRDLALLKIIAVGCLPTVMWDTRFLAAGSTTAIEPSPHNET